jgi:anti-sigma factor (TIGR02949 family)
MTEHRHDHQALSCEQVLEHLFEYLDRALDARANADIERHLAACRVCFGRAEFERRLRQRVADTATSAAPERLRERVKALVEKF